MKPFLQGETGTDILIFDAQESKKSDTAMEYFTQEIPALIVHWFWAKIVSPNEEKRINFHVFFDGLDYTDEMLDPKDTYPYKTFVKAYLNVCDYYNHRVGATAGGNIFVVSMDRPKVNIGAVGLRKTPCEDFLLDKYIDFDWERPVVALMRDVEFVVTYQAVAGVDISGLQDTRCFGVFHTDRLAHKTGESDGEMERYFRSIENSTHNKWIREKNVSNDYLKRVLESIPGFVTRYLGIKTFLGNNASISAIVAQRLGAKLHFGFGSGASDDEYTPQRENKNAVVKRSSFVRLNQAPEVEFDRGKKLVRVYYKAKLAKDKKLELRFTPYILTNSQGERLDVANGELVITLLTKVPKGNEKYTTSWRAVNGVFTVEKDGGYYVTVEANVDCAFMIKVEKQEVLIKAEEDEHE